MDAFEIIPGDNGSKVIIHVPHASTKIPEHLVNDFALSSEELAAEAHIMADIHTDALAQAVFSDATVKPWLFINRTSRLVFDPERFDDESEVMNSVGMGVVYTMTSDQRQLRDLSAGQHQAIVDEYFTPYSFALESLVTSRLEAVGEVTLIDLHSYAEAALPYEIHKDGARPAVCLGVDEFHTPQSLIDRASEAFNGVGSVAINTPFEGTYVPLRYYGIESKVRSIMLEIRKDTYGHGDSKAKAFASTVEAIGSFAASC